MSSSGRIALDNWLKTIDVQARTVIDIGGSQQPIKGRTKSWEVQEYLIADLSNPHKDSPQPDIEIDMNYKLSIHEAFSMAADVIFCLEVADYIWNPVAFHDNIANLMKPGARAYVSYQSCYPLHQPIDDDALRFMPGGIAKLAQNSGLIIASMTPRRFETNLWEQTYRAERMRAAKHEDHNFSGWLVEYRK